LVGVFEVPSSLRKNSYVLKLVIAHRTNSNTALCTDHVWCSYKRRRPETHHFSLQIDTNCSQTPEGPKTPAVHDTKGWPIKMSSGIPTNGTATADLCPLDGRRSSTEMWVKLFVVHFTTISFFCHLLSIRKEPIFTPKLILYILNPLVLFLHYGLALCAIILGQCMCSNEGYQDPIQALRWLFGTIARETGPDYDLISSPPRVSRTESQLRRKRRDKL
jgi:hypothetical protein